jgi:hypothetical protein
MKILLPLLMFAALPCAVVAAEFDPGMSFSDVVSQAGPAPETPASAPAESLSPHRVGELVRQSADWQARKDDALSALDTLVSNRAKPPNVADWRLFGSNVKCLAESIEAQQDLFYATASARARAEETDPQALAGRLVALQILRDFRKYATYANMLPRIMDESVCGGDNGKNCTGRQFAGPRWKMWLTWDESTAINRALEPQTGFSLADQDAMSSAVAKDYTAKHPLPPEHVQPR